MGNGWTPERRKKQSEDIHRYKPWTRATGPKTKTGKAICSQNAWKGGWREELREFTRLMRSQNQVLEEANLVIKTAINIEASQK